MSVGAVSISCKASGDKYIGDTGRSLYTYVKEHLADKRLNRLKTPLGTHKEQKHGKVDFEIEVTILAQEQKWIITTNPTIDHKEECLVITPSARTFTVTGITGLPVTMVDTSAVNTDKTTKIIMMMMEHKCIIVGNTVTGICASTMDAAGMCTPVPNNAMVLSVPDNRTSISGILSTRNIIMANWSKAMWERVVNRAVRMLASGPVRSHFFSTFPTVTEN
ncbi:hypothetical protein KIN20_030974 [Parelaphostrongylus tenuis]|uniref:Uncharacterized protein n=1 Tax=Parelaphostrongylus tenuis TaxID=148309 RepID=A0AAD5R4Z0_PARTN|nr:hypothetical protein KIN20_030974 [Parelaphostrongylus tenuis]